MNEFTPAVAVKAARRKEGLTQKQLARKLKIGNSRIAEMEQGKFKITTDMAKRLGEILRIHYQVFL